MGFGGGVYHQLTPGPPSELSIYPFYLWSDSFVGAHYQLTCGHAGLDMAKLWQLDGLRGAPPALTAVDARGCWWGNDRWRGLDLLESS